MEILTMNHNNINSNTNENKNNSSSSWGHQNQQQQQHHLNQQQLHQYPRAPSNLSLASIVTAATSEDNYSIADCSFHTCYESLDDPLPFNNNSIYSYNTNQNNSTNNMTSMSSVPSFGCLEDVMEEDNNNHMNLPSNSSTNSTSHNSNISIIPMQSYAQLQQQPLSPKLTAARLALSSDIGVLRRSISSSSSNNSPAHKNNHHNNNNNKQMAQILYEREQIMSSSALPMSRSFATPRVAIGTAFQPSSYCSSGSGSSSGTGSGMSSSSTTSSTTSPRRRLDSTTSSIDEKELYMMTPPLSMERDYDYDIDNDNDAVPMMMMEDEEEEGEEKKEDFCGYYYMIPTNNTRTIKLPPSRARILPPPCLESLADDIQIHILSFLSLHDVRSVMATNSQYRKLLFTQNAQNLWQRWCNEYHWPQLMMMASYSHQCLQTQHDNNNNNNSDILIVDDLSLPTAARPSPLTTRRSSETNISSWHHQANLSLLLSMAQTQPTDIDREQLHKYTSWLNNTNHRQSRRRRRARRISTMSENSQPLLHCHYSTKYQEWVVQFTGRVGQGDRCVRSNRPLPRPTLITTSSWTLPTHLNIGIGSGGYHHQQQQQQSNRHLLNHNRHHHDHHHRNYGFSTAGTIAGSHHQHNSLFDLFCRSARAIASPEPAWRPFVAPFMSKSGSVHLTPRFCSYFEVSIIEPQPVDNEEEAYNNEDNDGGLPHINNNNNNNRRSSNSADCVAVGVSTEEFDWHARMPGWDSNSFGYHGDDGGIFHSSGGMLRRFGPSYGRGDVVGCGIDHVARGIFFTLNGKFLGYGWTKLPVEMLQRDFYPVVGIDTNDWIHCNFGTEPFHYDFQSLIVQHEDLVHQSLATSASRRTIIH